MKTRVIFVRDSGQCPFKDDHIDCNLLSGLEKTSCTIRDRKEDGVPPWCPLRVERVEVRL